MKKFNILLVLIAFGFIFSTNQSIAQIWEPDGLNMPGQWNNWDNPPTNVVLAGYNQVPGGTVVRITNGTDSRWNTSFGVSATGDILPGTFDWLFTCKDGSGNVWANKWAGVAVTMNSIQNYTYNTGVDNNVTLTDGNWYVVNYEDVGYVDTRAIFMEVSAEPADILSVSVPANPMPNTAYGIDITLSVIPSPEEVFYVRYTTDNWMTSTAVQVSLTGTNGTATIPGQAANTQIDYYAFSSSVAGINSDYSLYTMKYNNNGDANYTFSIGNPPPPSIGWCNLQWPQNGSIDVGQGFTVYGKVWLAGVTDQPGQGVGMQAWVGWSDTDTDPSTWVNWAPAVFNVDDGNNDEFMADLGAAIGQSGTYYYAMRYQYLDQGYAYGGFDGGEWDGINNVSGELTISSVIPLSNWSFAVIGLLLLTFVFIKFRK